MGEKQFLSEENQQVEYHKLRPRQLVERRKKAPVAYLGLGILEWHGLQNPLGLDGVKAHGIACYLASRIGGVVVPPLFWGDNRRNICEIEFDPAVNPRLAEWTAGHTQMICEKMELDKERFLEDGKRSEDDGGWELWERLIVRIFFQLQTLGFKVIVPIPGHYPMFTPLENAVKKYFEAGGKCKVFTLTDRMYSDTGKAGDHAGAFETSVMMALFPELVDLNELDKNLEERNIGVLGQDPRIHASREYGQDILDKFELLTRKYLTEQGII